MIFNIAGAMEVGSILYKEDGKIFLYDRCSSSSLLYVRLVDDQPGDGTVPRHRFLPHAYAESIRAFLASMSTTQEKMHHSGSVLSRRMTGTGLL